MADANALQAQTDLGDGLPAVGALLNGKYRIERVLGRGGMGIVYAALHEQLGERVALKLMLEDATRSPEAVGRFLNEARAAVKIKNEHVARVMDVGTLDHNGAAFMALEYLEGRDLADLLSERRSLPVPVAVDYVLQALEAVSQAHALGIVHRDLKPANMFLARQQSGEDIVKVLDFGISKADTLHQQGAMTATKAVLGSPLYMSPEQLRSSRSVDARADIWSLGVILYELTTGSVPFDGETLGAIFATILEEPATPPRNRMPEMSPDLERIILKCLQRRPDDRYVDVAGLASDLAPHAPPGHRSIRKIQRTMQQSNAMTQGPGSDPQLPTSARVPSNPSLPSSTMVLSPPPSSRSVVHAASPSATHHPTGSSWGAAARSNDALPTPRARSIVMIAALACAALALLIGGLLWRRTPHHSVPTPAVADAPPSSARAEPSAAESVAAPSEPASPSATVAAARVPAPIVSGPGRIEPSARPHSSATSSATRPTSSTAPPMQSFQRDRN